MKLNDGFISYSTGEEQILVAAGPAASAFHGLARGNRTASFIIDCLKQEISKDALIDAVEAKYDAPRDVIARDVERILQILRQIGALDE